MKWNEFEVAKSGGIIEVPSRSETGKSSRFSVVFGYVRMDTSKGGILAVPLSIRFSWKLFTLYKQTY